MARPGKVSRPDQIQEVEGKDFFEAIARHDYTISSYTWIGDLADPLAFLQMWTSEKQSQ